MSSPPDIPGDRPALCPRQERVPPHTWLKDGSGGSSSQAYSTVKSSSQCFYFCIS